VAYREGLQWLTGPSVVYRAWTQNFSDQYPVVLLLLAGFFYRITLPHLVRALSENQVRNTERLFEVSEFIGGL
jgi:hypothetical protein